MSARSFFGLGLLLLERQVRQGLRDGGEPVAVFGDVIGRPALVGDVLGDLAGRHHIDGVPRAPAFAQGTADAPLQVNVAEILKGRLILARHLVDAIDRTYLDTRVTASAVVRPDDREFSGKFLAYVARALRHDRSLLPRLPTCAASAPCIAIIKSLEAKSSPGVVRGTAHF